MYSIPPQGGMIHRKADTKVYYGNPEGGCNGWPKTSSTLNHRRQPQPQRVLCNGFMEPPLAALCIMVVRVVVLAAMAATAAATCKTTMYAINEVKPVCVDPCVVENVAWSNTGTKDTHIIVVISRETCASDNDLIGC